MNDALTLASALVRRFEGFSTAPYRCPAGRWTIGYGSTFLENGAPVTASTPPITREQAEALMENTLSQIETHLRTSLPPSLTAPQTAALMDFAYNLGWPALNGSTLMRRLRNDDFEGAAAQFPLWVHARVHNRETVLPGLVDRRAAERALFESPSA